MKVKLIKPCRLNALPCEVEVTELEAHRLQMFGLCELPTEEKKAEKPEKKKKAEKPEE